MGTTRHIESSCNLVVNMMFAMLGEGSHEYLIYPSHAMLFEILNKLSWKTLTVTLYPGRPAIGTCCKLVIFLIRI